MHNPWKCQFCSFTFILLLFLTKWIEICQQILPWDIKHSLNLFASACIPNTQQHNGNDCHCANGGRVETNIWRGWKQQRRFDLTGENNRGRGRLQDVEGFKVKWERDATYWPLQILLHPQRNSTPPPAPIDSTLHPAHLFFPQKYLHCHNP